MKQIFLLISIIVGIIAPTVGAYSIIKGKFRPQRMTRFLLVLITFLIVATLFAQKDRNAIYLASITFLGALTIFILSMKKGIGGTTKSDIIICCMTIASLIIWQTTKNAILGLSMSILTASLAFIPTIIKSWKSPETEE